MIIAITYLLAITMAEVVTVFIHPLWGIAVHTLIFLTAIFRAATASSYRPLMASLALVPLVRIISLSMPLAGISQIWWYPIIYAPLLAAAVLVAAILSYRLKQVGLTFRRLPVQILIGLTGVAFGAAEYFILMPEGVVPEFSWLNIWLPILIFMACTGFVEELIFRGVLQHSAVTTFGKWGIVYVSLLFAVLHIGFRSVVDVALVFAIAVFFGWVVEKTGSLIGVTLSHGLANAMLYVVLPLLLR